MCVPMQVREVNVYKAYIFFYLFDNYLKKIMFLIDLVISLTVRHFRVFELLQNVYQTQWGLTISDEYFE